MTQSAKREWNPRISLEEAHKVALGWLVRSRQKNVLAPLPPTLYMAHVCDEAPFAGLMRDYTALFRFSSRDDHELDRARDVALRLLSVALKAHYFLCPQESALHEPYLFTFPDVSRPGQPHYGIVYKTEARQNSTILAATCDLGLVSSLKPEAYRFPVVLTKNSYKWLDKKHWAHLSSEGDAFRKILKPWEMKNERDVIERWTDTKDFPFGTLIDVPYELKDFLKPVGLRWADGLRKWFLPKGFDLEPVLEYLRWLEDTSKNDRKTFEERFWRHFSVKARVAQAGKSSSPSASSASGKDSGKDKR